jgi:hypothetical protein
VCGRGTKPRGRLGVGLSPIYSDAEPLSGCQHVADAAGVECNDQAVAFDILQEHIKALDQLLHNMADIDDMTDALDDAAKKAGRADDYHAKAHRQARAYKALQPILTAAMQEHDELESPT